MKFFQIILLCLLANIYAVAQEEDLLAALGEEEETTNYATASFKTNRVINMHSLENTAAGVLDMKISHRFGFVNQGFYDLFGLDQATQRIGFDYGITNALQVGINRNSVDKAYDAFVKYKFLRQSTGKKKMPISAAIFTSVAVNTLKWTDKTRENYFSSRLYYATQLIIGRKFSDDFTLQISPSYVHRNLVSTKAEKNDVFACGFAGRYKINKRVAFNAEYIYVLPNQLAPNLYNSLSVGLDIETGGHVFQLHFTNSNSMSEYGFISETNGDFWDGDIRFGFNVSRVFTLKRY